MLKSKIPLDVVEYVREKIGHKEMTIKNILLKNFIWLLLGVSFLVFIIILLYMDKNSSFDEVAIFEDRAKILEKTERGTDIIGGV